MTYIPPLNGGRINANIAGNIIGTTSLISTGTMYLAGGNNVTLSQNANTVNISAAAQSDQNLSFLGQGWTTLNSSTVLNAANVNMFGYGLVSVGGNNGGIVFSATQSNQALSAANGSFAFQTATFANSNGVSFSTGTQGLYASVQTNYLTTARASTDAIGLNTAASNVTWTANSSGLSLDARGYAGTGTTFSGTNVSGSITHNSAGINLALSAGAGGGAGFSAGVSGGNVAGNTGTVGSQLVFAGGNNVTLSQATAAGGSASITVSAANQTVQTQNMVSVLGSTGNISFANGNGVTFGANASTVSASVQTNYLTTARASTDAIGLNTAASNVTWTANSSGLSLDAGGYAGTGTTFNGANVSGSITQNSAGLNLSLSAGAGGGGANPTLSFYQNLAPDVSAQPHAALAIPYNTLVLQPLSPIEGYGFPGDMTASTLLLNVSGSVTTTASSSSFSSIVMFGLYSLANSNQLNLVNSASTGWSAAAATNNSTGWGGARFLTFHSTNWSSAPNFSYNGKYWYGVIYKSTNFNNALSFMGQYLAGSTQRSGTLGVSQVTATTMGHIPFLGIYGTSITSMPATISNSQINKVNATAGYMPGLILNATFSAW